MMRHSKLQYKILKYLADNSSPHVTDIAEAINALRPSVSRSLRLLANNGFLEFAGAWMITKAGQARLQAVKKPQIILKGISKPSGLKFNYCTGEVSFTCLCGREELFLGSGGEDVTCDRCGRIFVLVHFVAVKE